MRNMLGGAENELRMRIWWDVDNLRGFIANCYFKYLRIIIAIGAYDIRYNSIP
jgi:hypothetical protein